MPSLLLAPLRDQMPSEYDQWDRFSGHTREDRYYGMKMKWFQPIFTLIHYDPVSTHFNLPHRHHELQGKLQEADHAQ
jgi:hypothetical protein